MNLPHNAGMIVHEEGNWTLFLWPDSVPDIIHSCEEGGWSYYGVGFKCTGCQAQAPSNIEAMCHIARMCK